MKGKLLSQKYRNRAKQISFSVKIRRKKIYGRLNKSHQKGL